MADDPVQYRTRAALERANADAATLDNVRDRCTRSAIAWEAMASRYEKVQEARARREGGMAAEPAS